MFLFGGFLAQSKSWQAILGSAGKNYRFAPCLAGNGLSVFAKYIPGKVLIILGRAGYLAEKLKQDPLSALSSLSLNTQLIALWSGLTVGTAGLFFIGGLSVWGWMILALWLGLSLAIFSPAAHKIMEKIITLFLKKEVHLPQVSIGKVIKTLPWFLLQWGCWSMAFYFLVIALHPNSVHWASGFTYPLAMSLGIMAIFAPGGIGIREGLMVGLLVMAGLTSTEATTISVASRLWFLIGEAFIFILAWWTDNKIKKAGNI